MKLLIRLHLLSTVAVMLGAALTCAAEPEFSLDLKMQHDTFKIGSAMPGTLTYTNLSPKSMDVYSDRGGDAHRSGYLIELRDANGKNVTPTIEGSVFVGFPAWRTLSPRETMDYSLDLSKLYQIGQPGTYTVWAHVLDQKSKSEVKSNSATVTVTK